MIKALILTHLWTLMIALVAWGLQRDKGRRLGVHFPSPRIWLGLIGLCFTPGLISLLPINSPVSLPTIEILEAAPAPLTIGGGASGWSINYLIVYFVLALLLVGRTLFGWARLQVISVDLTDEIDVFTTPSNLPPLTLSWPRRAVVVPDGLQDETALIRHERAHLRYHDAEVTLCLLVLRDLMLRSFGFSYLVRQWRLAIELRADQAATEMLSPSERKDYAALLLNGLRPGGDHKDGRTLPCPTAHLTSTRHRSVKMRLAEIMEQCAKPRKRRWSAALLASAMGAGALGLLSVTATADDAELIIPASEITYMVRVPPKMPESCTGLDTNDIKIVGKNMWVDSGPKLQHVMTVGEVILSYDARANGVLENIRVVKSNHPCFESNAKEAVAQWIAKPQDKAVTNIQVMIQFIVQGETHEELEPTLNRLLK